LKVVVTAVAIAITCSSRSPITATARGMRVDLRRPPVIGAVGELQQGRGETGIELHHLDQILQVEESPGAAISSFRRIATSGRVKSWLTSWTSCCGVMGMISRQEGTADKNTLIRSAAAGEAQRATAPAGRRA
jgi:hypothetical protein